MSRQPTVSRNTLGGYYEDGRCFTQAKWLSILQEYKCLLEKNGICTVRALAKASCISLHSANRAIHMYKQGLSVMPTCQKGHGRRGVGSQKRFSSEHHAFMYFLYLNNPSMPLYGYCEEFHKKYNMKLTDSFVKRWFDEVGPFKGTLRVTSSHPTGRYSESTIIRLAEYIELVTSIEDHTTLVFSDEKPMKEVMIFPRVRKDPFTGYSPKNISTSSSKNRYNILATVNLKGGDIPPVYFEVLEETTTSAIYLQFVKNMIEDGVLKEGDFFIVDNCSIHCQGENTGLKDALWDMYGVKMITLPPYSPEFNPTELVFNALRSRLLAERARYTALDAADFLDAIKMEMENFDMLDVIKFYKACGYLK